MQHIGGNRMQNLLLIFFTASEKFRIASVAPISKDFLILNVNKEYHIKGVLKHNDRSTPFFKSDTLLSISSILLLKASDIS